MIELPQIACEKQSKMHQKLRCKRIKLLDPVKKQHESFKLYNEQDAPFAFPKSFNNKKKEPLCDDDCLTENEQIESAKRAMNKDLKSAIKNYFEDPGIVENIDKYTNARKKQRYKQ